MVADGAPAADDGTTGLITVIVPAEAAQYIAALRPDDIYLALVARDYKPVPQEPIDLNSLPAEDGALLTPYGPEGPDSAE